MRFSTNANILNGFIKTKKGLIVGRITNSLMYQTYASYMGCMTYFNTITHPCQNLRTLSLYLRTPKLWLNLTFLF